MGFNDHEGVTSQTAGHVHYNRNYINLGINFGTNNGIIIKRKYVSGLRVMYQHLISVLGGDKLPAPRNKGG